MSNRYRLCISCIRCIRYPLGTGYAFVALSRRLRNISASAFLGVLDGLSGDLWKTTELLFFAFWRTVQKMPRPLRVHRPGGFYHAILRGNNRKDIFYTESDLNQLSDLVSDGIDRYECRIHAFCWMTNHIHLLVQIGHHPLARLMRYLGTEYGRYLNRRLSRSGHVFERRHRAILVDRDSYLVELVRYIHRNPVTGGLVEQPGDYSHSSHLDYLGHTRHPWITTHRVLSMFGSDGACATENYASFLSTDGEADTAEIFQSAHKRVELEGWFENLAAEHSESDTRPTLQEITRKYCSAYGVDLLQLTGRSRARHLSRVRRLISIDAFESGAASVAEIARYFNRDDSTISRAISSDSKYGQTGKHKKYTSGT